MTLLAIEFDWDLLGVAATDADDRLVLPSAPTGPGLYRLRTETGPGLPWVHIGESADLSGRLAAIARPRDGRSADARVNRRLVDALAAGDRVMIWTITEAWTLVNGGRPVPLDLRRQSNRLLVADAALLAGASEEGPGS